MRRTNAKWPEPGDNVFSSTPGGRRENLCLGFYPLPEDWERLYVDGFKQAADCVVCARRAAPGPPYGDELLFPVAFLYRHYIELKLKQLLWYGQQLRLVPPGKIKGHKLTPIWTKARTFLEERWAGADPTPLDAIEEVISEFEHIDPKGLGFRYHIALDDTPLLQQCPDRVSLARLKETMDKVYYFFDCCSDALENDLEEKGGQAQLSLRPRPSAKSNRSSCAAGRAKITTSSEQE